MSKLISSIPSSRLLPIQPLSRHTSMRVGGYCDYLASVMDIDELVASTDELTRLGINYKVVGNGTNLIASDLGYRGVIVKLAYKSITIVENMAIATGGVDIARLARLSANQCYSGLEWAVGIPATIGGAISMNASAYGSCIADSLISVDALIDGEIYSITNKECCFGYRDSIFRHNHAIIVSAAFRILPSTETKLNELINRYDSMRQTRQPKLPSAGSIFKNPLGCLPAGHYLEQARLKGVSCGKAMVSRQHANFIVNSGGATASDIRKLIGQMQSAVKEKFDVDLIEEVEYIGVFV